jgi:hypothetical protein
MIEVTSWRNVAEAVAAPSPPLSSQAMSGA